MIFLKEKYLIHDYNNRKIYIKSAGDDPPKEFITEIGNNYWYGRSFRKLFNDRCVAYINESKVMVFEVEDNLTLGRKGKIKEGYNNTGVDTFLEI